LRKKLFILVDQSVGDGLADKIYDFSMMLIIFVSLIPLAFKDSQIPLFVLIDRVAVTVFITDYLLRWLTADHAIPQRGKLSFLFYPFTPMAIVDLLCILPSVTALSSGFRILKILRLLRTMRVLRVFKLLRYSKSFVMIINVLRKQKEPLLAVASLAIGYVVLSALIIFNVEPDSFDNFFEAIYWATVSLTTMGYGDIYPVTTIGRWVTMISAVLGIAIVALPAGIITAGYMNELNSLNKKEEE